MIGIYTVARPIWKVGVLWELEVQFSIDNDGVAVVEGAQFVGYYPERDSQDRDYVPLGLDIDIGEIDSLFLEQMREIASEDAAFVDENDDGDY